MCTVQKLSCNSNTELTENVKCVKLIKIHVIVQKCKASFTFSKAIYWAGLESLPGRFWPLGFMFDTPALEDLDAGFY